jgi:hypothetical protein
VVLEAREGTNLRGEVHLVDPPKRQTRTTTPTLIAREKRGATGNPGEGLALSRMPVPESIPSMIFLTERIIALIVPAQRIKTDL